MEETYTTQNNDERRARCLLFLKKHQFKLIITTLLIISLIICLILVVILFHRPSSTGKTTLPRLISEENSTSDCCVPSTSPLLTIESNFEQKINTTSFHNVSYNIISKSIPFIIMTFNIQFYSTSKTTKPIADFILSHKPDVACLQENLYISDWNLTKLAPLNLDKEYFLASDCQAEGAGQTHLSNTIYVRNKYFNFTQALSNVNLQITDETLRCSSVIQFYDTRIANLHLCGGRFDDKKFEKLQNHKQLQLERLISTHNPDIILGDFNNENSEEAIMKQLQKYKFYQDLKISRKHRFMQYFSSATRYLRDHTNYVPAYNETIIGSTSVYGGTPDWVYVKNQTRLTGRINSYNTISMGLSDHNAVTVEYLFPKNQNV